MNMTEFWYAFDQGERNFQGVKITDIIFDAIELDGVNFIGANLSGAKIRKSVFRNCIFTEASFKAADFTRSSFIHSHLQATNFTELIAVELVFDQCDMSSSKFINAEMGDVFFNDCDLSQTHWQDSWWCGGLEECNLIQANMSNISASCIEIIDSIYPNGEKGSGSWQNLIIQSEIPTPDSPQKIYSRDDISIQSTVGIDYSHLKKLLNDCQWEAAQEITEELLWKLMRESKGYPVEKESVMEIPCMDLLTIDRLWIENSWGRFGLSIQNQIWLGICKKYTCDSKTYNRFCKFVKWDSPGFIYNQEINTEKLVKQVPFGYYPAIGGWPNFNVDWKEFIGRLYFHLSECQIHNSSKAESKMVPTNDVIDLYVKLEELERKINQLGEKVDLLIQKLIK